MKFFIPDVEPDKQEEMYETFAAMCRMRPLPDGQRIQSITWDKTPVETWTAEIGKPLSGTRQKVTGRGATRRESTDRLVDQATVLAIFSGNPYMVVTDRRLDPTVRSAWDNPFLADSSPSSVTKFEASEAPEANDSVAG
ncbi:hypothetical protein JOE31_001886 [Arthrobacter sp. PvP023]|uniref:hypothetical protein n=1 Tax=Micrococcaceae TaxID=1268 RepID=UPI001AE162D3|nr:hypothetical protein [Arthrobacter sp. PvP023]MBP1135654.1 hypothetical protein [Arthrobacter sp. PvP023]